MGREVPDLTFTNTKDLMQPFLSIMKQSAVKSYIA